MSSADHVSTTQARDCVWGTGCSALRCAAVRWRLGASFLRADRSGGSKHPVGMPL